MSERRRGGSSQPAQRGHKYTGPAKGGEGMIQGPKFRPGDIVKIAGDGAENVRCGTVDAVREGGRGGWEYVIADLSTHVRVLIHETNIGPRIGTGGFEQEEDDLDCTTNSVEEAQLQRTYPPKYGQYEVVQIRSSQSCLSDINGRYGAVLGRSQGESGEWGYGIVVDGEVWYVDESELTVTGKFIDNPYAGGTSIRVRVDPATGEGFLIEPEKN